jgi:arylsulfatase A-like enzyme
MNVIFFMSDQHNANCTGYMGHPIVKTPNLDALAAKGVWFNNMYSCSGICGPSRVSFFTGTYLHTHEHYYNLGDLRRKYPSILTELKKKNYTTIQSGKSHLPPKVAEDFDEMWTMDTYKRYLKEKGLAERPGTPGSLKNFMSSASALPEEEQNEVWTADRTIDFLRSKASKSKPFFVWCSFQRPHAPHRPPESYDDLYNPDDIPVDWDEYQRFEQSRLQNRPMIEDFWKIGAVRHDVKIFQKAVCRYLALVTLIDREIGNILKALEEEGLADDTIIVYTADHGDWAGRYGQLGKNLPAYDEIIRIPFIYYDPKRPSDLGRVVEGMYQNVDLFPTLLDRLELPMPPTVQGISFLRALDGWPGSQRPYVYSETLMEKTVRSVHWKLTFFVRHPEKGQLFKMTPEPDEINNLWDDPACQDVKMELMQELLAWFARTEQPGGMGSDWEEHIDTPWFRWLKAQPREAAVPAEELPNEK